ncbi:hypothetical protein L9F63_018114, partial [Diploptera punctata]
ETKFDFKLRHCLQHILLRSKPLSKATSSRLFYLNNAFNAFSELMESKNSSINITEVYETWKRLNLTEIEIIKILSGNDFRLIELINSTNPTTVMTECYCSGTLREILIKYRSMHGYLSLIVCFFGTVANALNVAVLTRKDMACAPINKILTALAIADMLVMVEYIPYASYQYLVLPNEVNMPYRWAVFVLFHSHFTQVLHTISICLTLVLAIWRYIAIRFPERSYMLCTDRRCNMAIAIGYILPLIVCIPTYILFKIQATLVLEHGEVIVLYHIGMEDDELYDVIFWIYSIIIKLLPCVILTVISCWLIKALYRANRRKQALKGYNNCNNPLAQEKRQTTKSEKRTDRTTKMLVAVLLLFLITEFPQGILGLLSGLLGKCFFRTCYYLFGEVMDILALLNGAINFILYCSMSRQFRMTFAILFKPQVLIKWSAPSSMATEIQSTYTPHS